MFINKDSIKIKVPGGSYISLGNYDTDEYGRPISLILEAKYGFNKLWASDSGRNLAGTMSGTLIGIFPKITIQFGKLTKAQAEAIIPIIDSPTQVVSYYDPNKKTQIEMTTYTGDYEITNKNIVDAIKKNEGFSVSFIAIRKRS